MSIKKETYQVEEMSCAVCAQSVESILSSLKGVRTANVNFASASVLIEFDEEQVSEQDFEKSVKGIGYKLILGKSNEDVDEIEAKEKDHLKKVKQRSFYSLLIA